MPLSVSAMSLAHLMHDADDISDDGSESLSQKKSFFVPESFELRIGRNGGVIETYKLGPGQRIFVTLEDPASSISSEYYGFLMMAVIILSVLDIILSSERPFQYIPNFCTQPACSNDPNLCPGAIICAPVEHSYFKYIRIVYTAFFTADYMIKMGLCSTVPTRLSGLIEESWDHNEEYRAAVENRDPEPKPIYPAWQQFLLYAISTINLVDLASILPFYISLGDGRANSFGFIRLLRVVRLFKMMRMLKGPMIVIQRSLWNSRHVISILAIILMLCSIFFACILFYVEGGIFEVSEFTASAGFPNGAYVRRTGDTYRIQSLTPFDSISSAIYWSVITCTTVGYGDVFPVTKGGRTVACVAAVTGIIVLAMPIGVISNAFNEEYEKYITQRAEGKLRREKEKKRLVEKARSLRQLSREPGDELSDSTIRGDQSPVSPSKYVAIATTEVNNQGRSGGLTLRMGDEGEEKFADLRSISSTGLLAASPPHNPLLGDDLFKVYPHIERIDFDSRQCDPDSNEVIKLVLGCLNRYSVSAELVQVSSRVGTQLMTQVTKESTSSSVSQSQDVQSSTPNVQSSTPAAARGGSEGISKEENREGNGEEYKAISLVRLNRSDSSPVFPMTDLSLSLEDKLEILQAAFASGASFQNFITSAEPPQATTSPHPHNSPGAITATAADAAAVGRCADPAEVPPTMQLPHSESDSISQQPTGASEASAAAASRVDKVGELLRLVACALARKTKEVEQQTSDFLSMSAAIERQLAAGKERARVSRF